MKIANLENKSILILGIGREGMSTLHFLSRHFPNKYFAVADLKTDIPELEKVEKTYLGKDYLDGLKDYNVIIKSPGISNLEELETAQEQGKKIISATQIFFDNFEGQIIGVTGTKGKSTTSSLIYKILKSAGVDVYLLGNIGVAPLDLLDKTNKDSVVVYELSSFQLESLDVSPHIAVITNIYPEHLDRYKSFEDYTRAKENITRYQSEKDYLIYDDQSLILKQVASRTYARAIPISQSNTNIIDWKKVTLKGEANMKNIKAAILAARLLNISETAIKQAVEAFSTLPHRLEFAGEKNGIKFYNDSLSTIPQATIAALEALGEDVQTLIVGGFDRGIDYAILGPAILSSRLENLILFPTTGEKIWEGVTKIAKQESGIKKFNAENMEEAVKIAIKVTDPGKIVLLSPASSSFNMFKDYEDRGNQFVRLIDQ